MQHINDFCKKIRESKSLAFYSPLPQSSILDSDFQNVLLLGEEKIGLSWEERVCIVGDISPWGKKGLVASENIIFYNLGKEVC